MQYKFTIDFSDTDGDFGLKFVPNGTRCTDNGYFLQKVYDTKDKAIEDVTIICNFIKENAHGKSSVLEDLGKVIEKFLDDLKQGRKYTHCSMTGNQDSCSLEFEIVPFEVSINLILSDKEYAMIKANYNNVTYSDIKATILKLYTSKDEQ